MMNSKELRNRAWESLKGKYWIAFVATLITGFLSSIGTNILNLSSDMVNIVNSVDPKDIDTTMRLGATVIVVAALVIGIIGLLISIFIGNAALVGTCNYFIKNTDSKPSIKDVFNAYKVNYGRNTVAILIMGIKLTLWYLLFIIPGIIKTFEYTMVPYILADDENITTKEAFIKAKEMMNGNKWRLFKLNFSFIGWILLSIVTFGIGVFFLNPYIEAANAEFYAELKNK